MRRPSLICAALLGLAGCAHGRTEGSLEPIRPDALPLPPPVASEAGVASEPAVSAPAAPSTPSPTSPPVTGTPGGRKEKSRVLGTPIRNAEVREESRALVPYDPVVRTEDIEREFLHLFGRGIPDASVPDNLPPQIKHYVDIYTGRGKRTIQNWLKREGRYRSLILGELRAHDLPEDLIYLAMIESGFNPTAVSSAKATGLWQFMRGTGKQMGLRIDDWVDERKDPIASTRAAARHLRWLHNQLGDWALVAAAYNAGIGRVSRVRKDAGEDNYFRLISRGFFARETQEYVPRILAGALVAHTPERFGIEVVEREAPYVFETVEVPGRTRLSAIARAAEVEESSIVFLNPHLLKRATPPGDSYSVRVPQGTSVREFARRFAALSPKDRDAREAEEGTMREYPIRSGDSWWSIAKKHGTTIAALKKDNPGVKMLIAGKTLKVRVGGDKAPVERAPVLEEGSKKDRPKKPSSGSFDPLPGVPVDTTQRGSRMAVAGEEADARGSQMSSDSSLSLRERLERTLEDAPPERVHVVSAGETMGSIASRYGVSVADLVLWNSMSAPRPLRMGELIRVRVTELPTAVSPQKSSPPQKAAPDAAQKAAPDAAQKAAPDAAKKAKDDGDRPREAQKKSSDSGTKKKIETPEVKKKPAPRAKEHKVVSGETLSGLAQRFEVTQKQLMTWNDMPEARPLRIGEVLRVQAPEPQLHVVASGETLTELARRYGVGISDLVEWNGMEQPRPLRIGEKLRVSDPS